MTPKYTILQRPRRALLPRISQHTRWSGCFPTRSQPRPRNKITNPSPTSNPPPPPRSSSIFSSPTLGPPPSPTCPLPPFPRPNLPRLPVRRHSTTPSDAQNRGTTSLLAEANPRCSGSASPLYGATRPIASRGSSASARSAVSQPQGRSSAGSMRFPLHPTRPRRLPLRAPRMRPKTPSLRPLPPSRVL